MSKRMTSAGTVRHEADPTSFPALSGCAEHALDASASVKARPSSRTFSLPGGLFGTDWEIPW